MRVRGRIGAALLLAGCAGPALTLYTLAPEAAPRDQPPLGGSLRVIAVARVAVPAELDSDDLLVRSGAVLHRSGSGRWASSLSNEMTERLAADLAARDPAALVTTAPQEQTPAYRIVVTLNRFDVSAEGRVAVAADWTIVPGNAGEAVRRGWTGFAVMGPVATDLEVVTLQGRAVDRLAGAIGREGMIGERSARRSGATGTP
jgi:uncharacterized lipoprotein YmbA